MFYGCMRAKSLQSCLTLGDSMDCIPPGSSVHGILQARILERVAISSSRRSCLGTESLSLMSSALAGGFFTTSTIWEAPSYPILLLNCSFLLNTMRFKDYLFYDLSQKEPERVSPCFSELALSGSGLQFWKLMLSFQVCQYMYCPGPVPSSL